MATTNSENISAKFGVVAMCIFLARSLVEFIDFVQIILSVGVGSTYLSLEFAFGFFTVKFEAFFETFHLRDLTSSCDTECKNAHSNTVVSGF